MAKRRHHKYVLSYVMFVSKRCCLMAKRWHDKTPSLFLFLYHSWRKYVVINLLLPASKTCYFMAKRWHRKSTSFLCNVCIRKMLFYGGKTVFCSRRFTIFCVCLPNRGMLVICVCVCVYIYICIYTILCICLPNRGMLMMYMYIYIYILFCVFVYQIEACS